jgi:hypothetical protein
MLARSNWPPAPPTLVLSPIIAHSINREPHCALVMDRFCRLKSGMMLATTPEA